jgi:hypothetical protein
MCNQFTLVSVLYAILSPTLIATRLVSQPRAQITKTMLDLSFFSDKYTTTSDAAHRPVDKIRSRHQ